MLSNIDTNANLAAHAKPGAFNDPCLLISADARGSAMATELQTRAQFSTWAMMASPLLISGNVRNMSAFNLQTYSNAEVIAVDQDVLGKQGTRLVGGPFTAQAYLSTCDAWAEHPRMYCLGFPNGDSTVRSLAASKAACLTNTACNCVTCAGGGTTTGCTIRVSGSLLESPTGEYAYVSSSDNLATLRAQHFELRGAAAVADMADAAAATGTNRTPGDGADDGGYIVSPGGGAAAVAGGGAGAGAGTGSNPQYPELCFSARGCQTDPTFGPCAMGGAPTCGGNASLPHPDQHFSLDAHTAQLRTTILNDPLLSPFPGCMDLSIFPYLMAKRCAPAAAVPPAQQWAYAYDPVVSGNGGGGSGSNGGDGGGGGGGGAGGAGGSTGAATDTGTPTITIRHVGSGACLTRGGLSNTNVWGRQLHGGNYALLFINVGAVAADVTCSTACWAAAGIGSGKVFAVRDVWKGKSAGTLNTTDPFTVHSLQPGGGVAMFRLSLSQQEANGLY